MEVQPIIDGLQVSGIGMGMTSLVLVILAISVRAVSWADATLRRREAQRAAEETAESEFVAPDTESDLETPDPRARVAAIAVALALAQRSAERESHALQTPTSVTAGAAHDAWLSEGRARQRASRGVAGSAKGWR